MIPYIKDFADYLGGAPDASRVLQLADEDGGFPACTLEYSTRDEEVRYLFTSALSGPEEAALAANVAAYVYETLAIAQARCRAAVNAYRAGMMRSPDAGGKTVEYPPASGKIWSLGSDALHEWRTLYEQRAGLSYPYAVQTSDGLLEHSFADQAALETVCGQIRDLVIADNEARDAALVAVREAGDIAAADAARDAYIGG